MKTVLRTMGKYGRNYLLLYCGLEPEPLKEPDLSDTYHQVVTWMCG